MERATHPIAKNGITIKQITSLTTLKQCAAIMIDAYNCPPWNNHWTHNTATALLTCYYNTPHFMGWAAMLSDKIVGCATGNIEPYYNGSIFYLRELFVDVQNQKTGIGKLLMTTLKNDLKIKGIHTLMLFTYKELNNFYAGFDFEELKDLSVMMCE